MGSKQELVDAGIAFGDAYGVPLNYHILESENDALTQLRTFLDNGQPIVALVKYEPWQELTGNDFAWDTLVLVVGYDSDSIYIHDPLFGVWQPRDVGAYFQLPTDLFMAGWGGFPPTEIPNWSALVPDKPLAHRLIFNATSP